MICITGISGFVGKNLSKYFDKFKIAYKNIDKKELQDINLCLLDDIYGVIHLAGIAHDLKNTNHQEYYKINTELANNVFEAFLKSNAKVFILLSSVKAVADRVQIELTEDFLPNPTTHYGKSKLLAEKYIFSKKLIENKRFYILRPCMIHGSGNKGNLNLLFKFVSKGIPWPLGLFENKRSFCSIDNLLFIIKELIEREDIPSGIYNVSDDQPLSTNEVISLIAKNQKRKPRIWKISKKTILVLAKVGDKFRLPFNSERLQKLTESYVVSNTKIKNTIGKPLPVKSVEGLLKTIESFK